MDFLTKFFQSLFSGIDPVVVALWLRGFFAALFGGLSAGAIDVLVQILSLLQSGDPFAINWHTVARTVAIAALPVLIAYLKKPPAGA